MLHSAERISSQQHLLQNSNQLLQLDNVGKLKMQGQVLGCALAAPAAPGSLPAGVGVCWAGALSTGRRSGQRHVVHPIPW